MELKRISSVNEGTAKLHFSIFDITGIAAFASKLLHFRGLALAMISRTLLAAQSVRKMPARGKALANWARPSIGELGVPTEPWLRVHEANQKKFSLQLLAGVVLFGGTVLVAHNSVELNGTPHHLLK